VVVEAARKLLGNLLPQIATKGQDRLFHAEDEMERKHNAEIWLVVKQKACKM
jgi:hypothetical protein